MPSLIPNIRQASVTLASDFGQGPNILIGQLAPDFDLRAMSDWLKPAWVAVT